MKIKYYGYTNITKLYYYNITQSIVNRIKPYSRLPSLSLSVQCILFLQIQFSHSSSSILISGSASLPRLLFSWWFTLKNFFGYRSSGILKRYSNQLNSLLSILSTTVFFAFIRTLISPLLFRSSLML